MRFLRIAAVAVFIAAVAFNLWATAQYKSQQDVKPPVIACPEDTLELTVDQGVAQLSKGLTATDDQDGDLTDKILVASTSHFLDKGTLKVSYVVFDASHNAGKATRKVTFTDYESPKFSLRQPLVYYRGQNIRFLDYITATDCLDGDITDKIKVVASDVSNYTPGVYPVLLEVSNSFGDRAQIELMVVVRPENSKGPEIALKEYITYIKAGDSFDPHSLISSVRAYGTGASISASEVAVLGTVDTETPGCYPLIYSCQQDGFEGTAYLTVVVTDREG